MTREHGNLLKEWQERLGLMDWVIVLEDSCSIDEMGDSETNGYANYQETNKTAVIQILNPIHYGERVVPFDWEKTLVHELLHLKTCLLSDTDDKLQERLFHQWIDDFARAFVDAKRSGQKEG